MSNKRDHSIRNSELSKDLFDGKKYFDWSVTTAFYSIIHLVEDVLLPRDINGVECKSIAEVRKSYSCKGRHEAREKLVSDHCPPDVSSKYKWLDDKSRYARYTTYKVTIAEAEKANQYLAYITKNIVKS